MKSILLASATISSACAGEFVDLFNGKDFSGWNVPQNNIWWKVVDGTISVKNDPKTKRPLSVQTSASRTLLDLAMKGRSPKIEILMFLIKQGLSIYDVQDTSLAPKTLEAILRAGFPNQSIDAVPSGVNVVESHHDESVTTIEDACALCCERPMDCVLIPCGHQICCTDCGQQVTTCPLCKVQCNVLRIFRQ